MDKENLKVVKEEGLYFQEHNSNKKKKKILDILFSVWAH